jgi:hypothetical protein
MAKLLQSQYNVQDYRVRAMVRPLKNYKRYTKLIFMRNYGMNPVPTVFSETMDWTLFSRLTRYCIRCIWKGVLVNESIFFVLQTTNQLRFVHIVLTRNSCCNRWVLSPLNISVNADNTFILWSGIRTTSMENVRLKPN